MNDRFVEPKVSLSIAAVERDTGLSKDTLRVWERRYGFPTPDRDGFGERAYPLDQIEKLRIIRRLLDAGHRPGRIMGMPTTHLQLLANATVNAPKSIVQAEQEHNSLQFYLDMIKAHKIEELRRTLGQAMLRLGLETYIVEVVAPLSRMVGEAWARGYLEIFEEHLYTESQQIILRNALFSLPEATRSPRVMLTTFPQESHGLSLLMVEALFGLEGARCISLGTMTPVWDIAKAATSQSIDIIALSFSAALNPNLIIEGLNELRTKVPENIEIWAGGGHPILTRKPPKGVHTFSDLTEIRPALGRWREASQAQPAALNLAITA